jgi:hypothetical protein
MSRKTEIFPDPANRQVAPDHLIVVSMTLAADHGDAQGDGFLTVDEGQAIIELDRAQGRSYSSFVFRYTGEHFATIW